MTQLKTILRAEHQRLRAEGVKPGSAEYERILSAVEREMRVVQVGDHDVEYEPFPPANAWGA